MMRALLFVLLVVATCACGGRAGAPPCPPRSPATSTGGGQGSPRACEPSRVLAAALPGFPCGWPRPDVGAGSDAGEVLWTFETAPGERELVLRLDPDEARGVASALLELADQAAAAAGADACGRRRQRAPANNGPFAR